MKFVVSAFIFLLSTQVFGEIQPMIRCSGDGYKITIFDNGYTYYTEATLEIPDKKTIKMDCGVYTGLPGSSWNCSDDSRAKWDVVVFGNEWDQQISAKLSQGSNLVATLTCKAVN